MTTERRVRTADDAAKAVHDLIKKAAKPRPDFLGPTTAGEGDEGVPAFANPMTDAGDLIVGGEDGAPTRRAIGTSGQVLQVVSGTAQWMTVAGVGPSGLYRFPLYTTYGGGDLLYTSDGHLMYVLEELE